MYLTVPAQLHVRVSQTEVNKGANWDNVYSTILPGVVREDTDARRACSLAFGRRAAAFVELERKVAVVLDGADVAVSHQP